MGYEREELLPKGWEKWYEKNRLDRYRELRRSAKYTDVDAMCYVLSTMFLCFELRNVPHSWIKFVDKKMRERNDEVLVIKLLAKAEPMHKYDIQEHLEANLRYSPFCNLRAWESRNRGKNERNQELKDLEDLKCVSFLQKWFLDTVEKIERNKAQYLLDRLYKHWEKKEERRKALREAENGRNTNGWLVPGTKPKGRVLSPFSGWHPVRQGFTFGY